VVLVMLNTCAIFRTGLKVGVLSGPGYCARSHRIRKSSMSTANSQNDEKYDESKLVLGVLKMDSVFPAKVCSVIVSNKIE